MKRFLFLIREDIQNQLEGSDEQFEAGIQEMTKWVEELAESGNYLGGEPLRSVGKYVSKDNVVSDGPFIEAKEVISGYLFVQAENINQAASIAQSCPEVLNGNIVIEVRPIVSLDND